VPNRPPYCRFQDFSLQSYVVYTGRYWSLASKTMRTARSMTSGEIFGDFLTQSWLHFLNRRSLRKFQGGSVSRSIATRRCTASSAEYLKRLRDAGLLESLMTERILKSSISVLEAFNDARNNKSLAHDPILNYEESLLIFNHVASSVRFIKALEARAKPMILATMMSSAVCLWR
jgi:Abortive infection C-terminus